MAVTPSVDCNWVLLDSAVRPIVDGQCFAPDQLTVSCDSNQALIWSGFASNDPTCTGVSKSTTFSQDNPQLIEFSCAAGPCDDIPLIELQFYETAEVCNSGDASLLIRKEYAFPDQCTRGFLYSCNGNDITITDCKGNPFPGPFDQCEVAFTFTCINNGPEPTEEPTEKPSEPTEEPVAQPERASNNKGRRNRKNRNNKGRRNRNNRKM